MKHRDGTVKVSKVRNDVVEEAIYRSATSPAISCPVLYMKNFKGRLERRKGSEVVLCTSLFAGILGIAM